LKCGGQAHLRAPARRWPPSHVSAIFFRMAEPSTVTRSPELMNAYDTALLVVDVQQKLIQLIPGWQRLVWNIGRLIEGTKILGVPALLTEQYPQGLGGTVAELQAKLGAPMAKQSFSCCGCDAFASAISELRRPKLLVVGIETHVCVQQTVLDLLATGSRVYVVADATGARHEVDYQLALRRMESAGATLTTTEAALFELCQTAGTPEFKALSALVRQQPPAKEEAS